MEALLFGTYPFNFTLILWFCGVPTFVNIASNNNPEYLTLQYNIAIVSSSNASVCPLSGRLLNARTVSVEPGLISGIAEDIQQ